MFNEESSNKKSLNIMVKTYFSYIKPTLQIAVFCILLGTLAIVEAQQSKSALSVEDINALIPMVEAAEEISFLNLKIESEMWVETKVDLSDPCESWQRTPIYTSCTAWFGGGSEGKGRVDVHKEVLRWRDGAAPYVESSYSVGFDGKHGRVVHYTIGHSGKTFHIKEGGLLPDAPEQLMDGYLGSCTGARFSLQFFFSDEDKKIGRTFSQFFRAATSAAALEAKAFEVTHEEFQEVECIKFGSGEKERRPHMNYWFDPARGFALLGYDNISIREDGSKRIITSLRVAKLKEVAPNIWWPTQVTSVMTPFEPNEPYQRYVYRASNVVANDPNFDKSIFTVPFPDGYLIDDKVIGKKYRVGEVPNAPKKLPKK